MTSTTAQFTPSRGMAIYEQEPIYQVNMWEDMFRGDVSTLQTDSHDPIGASGEAEDTRSLSDKVERRLAQNREAARKSRLRKKAYIQQLETSRLKLAQLELELERTRNQFQGTYTGGTPGTLDFGGTVDSRISAFEKEYGNWIQEQQRKNLQLRTVLQTPISDMELRILVENVLSHYYNLFRMKTEAAKADVFYLVSGIYRTSVERFLLWIGGFRPSELINIIMPQIEPLTEQQSEDVRNLRHSCQQAEDALTQGMDKLQQTISQSITIGNGSHLASAMEKLETLEIFINQADHLRQQTLHQMSCILTTRQTARGLLAFGEYFQRLRALSSLWISRPRENAYNC